MSPLRDLLRSFRASPEPGIFHAEITVSWMQGRTTFGGCSAALCLEGAKRHMEGGQRTLPLRSALVSFVGPVGGDVEVRTSVLRRGKTMTFVRSELFEAASGELATSCQFAFGAERPSGFDEAAGVEALPARLPAPDRCGSLFEGSPGPTFTQHFPARLARGARPRTGAEEAVRSGGVPGVDGDVALLCLADMPPPAMVPRFRGHVPVSSATWMINFLGCPGGAAPRAGEGGWFLLRSKAESARGGYSSQDMAIYGAGGAPIATGRQCVAIFDKPQSRL